MNVHTGDICTVKEAEPLRRLLLIREMYGYLYMRSMDSCFDREIWHKMPFASRDHLLHLSSIIITLHLTLSTLIQEEIVNS